MTVMFSIVVGFKERISPRLRHEIGVVMKEAPQSVTTIPDNPDAERRRRMLKYTIAMIIRVVCIVMMLFVQGWWLLVFAAGAIFLPYFAVLIANVPSPPRSQTPVRRPSSIVRWLRHDNSDSK